MRCLMRVIRRIVAVVVARTLLFEFSVVVAVTMIGCGCQFGMPRLLGGLGIHCRVRHLKCPRLKRKVQASM